MEIVSEIIKHKNFLGRILFPLLRFDCSYFETPNDSIQSLLHAGLAVDAVCHDYCAFLPMMRMIISGVWKT
jgi:hypothetical protein